MSARQSFSTDEAHQIGEQIGIDWATARFDVEQFRRGMNVELEHGLGNILTNVTGDDPLITGKIALAHLHEFPDYYTRLEQLEEQAKRDQAPT
jgi:Mn-dependent DtxR family transcriptional regulator